MEEKVFFGCHVLDSCILHTASSREKYAYCPHSYRPLDVDTPSHFLETFEIPLLSHRSQYFRGPSFPFTIWVRDVENKAGFPPVAADPHLPYSHRYIFNSSCNDIFNCYLADKIHLYRRCHPRDAVISLPKNRVLIWISLTEGGFRFCSKQIVIHVLCLKARLHYETQLNSTVLADKDLVPKTVQS